MSRTFYENANTYEQPPSVAERAADELYANAVNALAAVMRFDIETEARTNWPREKQFAAVLDDITEQLTSDAVDGLYLRDVFDQYGPGAVLLALKRAYEQPQPSAPLVGD